MDSSKQTLTHTFSNRLLTALRVFLALSFLATSAIYLLLITNHLFYGRTYLLDTGFWIGLSTGSDPAQLLEPSGINNDLTSYYNTHYSPIFSALQAAYTPIKNLVPPAGFFLLWFTSFQLLTSGMFALALNLALERLLSNAWTGARVGLILVATALTGSYWLAAGSTASIVSYASYPHTEIIGLQLSYIGLLMLILRSIQPSSRLAQDNPDRLIAILALFLIFVGSLFHELVALISLFNLIVLHLTGSRMNHRPGSNQTWINRRIQVLLGMIGLPLISWALLRSQGYFTGTFSSSLKRIYIGNNFDHLSIERYLAAIKEASTENSSALIVLIITLAISVMLAKRGLHGFPLYLLTPIGYWIASPLAVNNSAATLTAHYGYPMISVFYLFPMTLAASGSLYQSTFCQSGRSSAKLMVSLPLLAALVLAGHSMKILLRNEINIPEDCTPTSATQEAQQDTCISQPRLGTIWFRPGFVFSYVNLGWQLLQQAETRLSRLGNGNGKANRVLSDEQLAALYPNKFLRDNILASEEKIKDYRSKSIPKGRYYIRYHITDSLYSKDITPLLAKNGFRLVSKTRVGDLGGCAVYEYVWANLEDARAN